MNPAVLSPRKIAIVIGSLVGILAVALVPGLVTASDLYLLNAALATAIAASGLNLLMGYAGQVSIGNAALLGVGAYAAVLIEKLFQGPWPLLVVLGGVASALVSLLVGVPSLRLRGLYLAIGTLALHFIAVFAFQKAQGGSEIGFILTTPVLELEQWYWILVGLVLLSLVALRNLVNSQFGRALVAVRESELVAEGMGVDVRRVKLLAFTISGFFVGCAGVLASRLQGTVNWEAYTLELAFQHLAIVIIGGMGYLLAGPLGAIIVAMLPQVILRVAGQEGPEVYLLIDAFYGLLIVAVLLLKPGGVASIFDDIWRRICTLIDRSDRAEQADRHRSPVLDKEGA